MIFRFSLGSSSAAIAAAVFMAAAPINANRFAVKEGHVDEPLSENPYIPRSLANVDNDVDVNDEGIKRSLSIENTLWPATRGYQPTIKNALRVRSHDAHLMNAPSADLGILDKGVSSTNELDDAELYYGARSFDTSRDLGKEGYNSNDCGGNYPAIYVSGDDFGRLAYDCFRPESGCYTYPYYDEVLYCYYDFGNCHSPYNEVPLGCWDTSRVTNMNAAFNYIRYFNDDISFWNTAKVTTMAYTFSITRFNQDISYWDVSAVTSMYRLFGFAYKFNQPIDAWDVSNVRDMSRMFNAAFEFNQPLDNWDVGEVTDMRFMFFQIGNGQFSDSSVFNQCLSSWGQKVRIDVAIPDMFNGTKCPGINIPEPNNSPWCQRVEDGCSVVFRPFLSCDTLTSLSQDSLRILCNEEEIATNCPELCTFAPTSNPTNSPTSAPTSNPTDGFLSCNTLKEEIATNCPELCTSAPTAGPTESPTSAPSSSPTPKLDIDCEDKSKEFKIDIDGVLKTKDCEWVASKKKVKKKEYCKMKVEINGNEKKLPSICKKTCGELGKGECGFLKGI